MAGWELHVYFREDETSDMIKAEYVWDGWRRWWGKKQHGSQTSLTVTRRNSGFHSSLCWGIRTYVELRGYSESFPLVTLIMGFLSNCNR